MGLVILVVAGKVGLWVLRRPPRAVGGVDSAASGVRWCWPTPVAVWTAWVARPCVARGDRIFSPDLASDLKKPNPTSVQPVLSHLVLADGGGWGGGETGGNP